MLTKVLTRTFVGASIILFITAVNVQVGSFMAIHQGHDIRLEWAVANEAGVKSFDIYKKLKNEQYYTKLSSINPVGQRAYIYLDDNLYAKNDELQEVYYKLNIMSDEGNKSYFSSVQQEPTPLERSWSSIKSMFK